MYLQFVYKPLTTLSHFYHNNYFIVDNYFNNYFNNSSNNCLNNWSIIIKGLKQR